MLLLLTTKTRLNLKAGHLRIRHLHPFSEVKAPDTDCVCMCVELNLIWGERGLVEQLEPGVRGTWFLSWLLPKGPTWEGSGWTSSLRARMSDGTRGGASTGGGISKEPV